MGPSDLKLPKKKSIPMRSMPKSAAPVSPEATGHPVAPAADSNLAGGSSPHGLDGTRSAAPVFANPDFGSTNATSTAEDVLSPTEHGSRSFGEHTHDGDV